MIISRFYDGIFLANKSRTPPPCIRKGNPIIQYCLLIT